MAAQVTRRRFTVDEYHRMAQVGLLTEDDRVELIQGEIVEMAPIGSAHAACVARLTAWFAAVHPRAVVWVQNPIQLPAHSEPQPDLALLRPAPDFYSARLPGPEDVFLVVEVADATAEYDREMKLPLYAGYRVPEAWLVDLSTKVVEVHRHPGPNGYGTKTTAGPGRTISPEAFPELALPVGDLLGQ